MIRTILVAGAVAAALAGCSTLPNGKPLTTYGGNSASSVHVTTPASAPMPSPTDFRINVVEMSRDTCLSTGSCHVNYRIVPQYQGDPASVTSAPFTLLYTLTGADDPASGNVKFSGGKYQTEEGTAWVQEGVSLVATPTQVLED
jgi:hypothetical protein